MVAWIALRGSHRSLAGNIRIQLVVDLDGGRNVASSQALDDLKSEFPVLRGLAGLDL